MISKPHAYLQTMTKTSVKFRKNRHKTVGWVAHTRHLLLYGGRKEGRNAEYMYYVPSPLFSKKGGDKKFFKTSKKRTCKIQLWFLLPKI